MRLFKLIYRLYLILVPQFGINLPKLAARFAGFVMEYRFFRALDTNERFNVDAFDWYPCLTDRTGTTPLDPVYFHQDVWAARKIAEKRPVHHYDVGSSAKTIGIIAQFVPTTMIDIRPVELNVENLHFQKGSILELPFASGTIPSISSLCVVEHIGLGRYGDPFDQFGSEKAAAELERVCTPGGHIYFSVPVEPTPRVYFNAHRSFSVDQVRSMFPSCTAVEVKYICDSELTDEYRPAKGYVVGLFMFRKRA